MRSSLCVKGDAAARSAILYGHNVKDGSMFGRIDDCGSSPSFYKARPLVQYVDAAGKDGLWLVYSIRNGFKFGRCDRGNMRPDLAYRGEAVQWQGAATPQREALGESRDRVTYPPAHSFRPALDLQNPHWYRVGRRTP